MGPFGAGDGVRISFIGATDDCRTSRRSIRDSHGWTDCGPWDGPVGLDGDEIGGGEWSDREEVNGRPSALPIGFVGIRMGGCVPAVEGG